VATKASVSLLRYADLIPADRAFYGAGTNAKVANSKINVFFHLKIFKQTVGWDNLAFVLLNRFLDIADMIEENGDSADATLLDNTDFEQTDVPYDKLCIPVRPCVNGVLKEQAKEWVLAISLDQRIEQVS
jgi:intraflagellar transport protein 172